MQHFAMLLACRRVSTLSTLHPSGPEQHNHSQLSSLRAQGRCSPNRSGIPLLILLSAPPLALSLSRASLWVDCTRDNNGFLVMLSGGFWGAVTSFSLHAVTAQSKPQNESSGPAREPLMLSIRRHAAARHVPVLYASHAYQRLLFTAFGCCCRACAWWCRMLAVA